MTDYLNTVKKLVERLNLHPGDARFKRTKSKREEKTSVSDMTKSGCDNVIYRHRKPSTGKDFSDVYKPRKKCRGDIPGNSPSIGDIPGDSTGRGDIPGKSLGRGGIPGKSSGKSDIPGNSPCRGDSPGLTKRRASVSLYQLIKSNKEKCLRKNSAGIELNISLTKSPKKHFAVEKKETIFQYNVESTHGQTNNEAIDFVPTLSKKLSPRGSTASISPSLLSPIAPMVTEPTSPKNSRSSRQLSFRKSSGSDTLKSPNPDLRSPLDPVFSENPTSISRRKNNGTFRPRLSASKSVPLSPPADNPEKVAQQNGDFQYKLDTLRAELLAMRKADQELARRLLNLYTEIQVLKVKNSCMNYSELLDEAYYEAEMADEVPDMCDAPQKFSNKLLTSHGVTSFNIHSRRFSCS